MKIHQVVNDVCTFLYVHCTSIKKLKINPIYYILRSYLPDITKRKSVHEPMVPKKKTLNSISVLLPITLCPHKI